MCPSFDREPCWNLGHTVSEALGAFSQQIQVYRQGCPTFWHLWAILEEESSWATH